MMDDLLDLQHRVGNAAGWLRDALATAGECCTDEDGTPNGWGAMKEVAERLAGALRQLETALDPVREDIRAAQKWYDEMADRADGLSY